MLTRSLPATAYLLTATTAIIALSPTTALSAPAIDQQGAEQVKSAIQAYIEEQKQISAASGSELVTEGELTVTPTDGKYYAVVTPYIKMLLLKHRAYKGSNQTAENMPVPTPTLITYDIGKISINVMPTDNADEWKFSYSLPTNINFLNGQNEKMATITLGSQQAAGIWNTKLHYTSKAKINYQDVTFTADSHKGKPPVNASMKDIDIVQNFTHDAATNSWAGPIKATASNVTLTKNGQNVATIGEVGVDYSISGMNTEIMEKVRDEVKKLGEMNEPETNPYNNPRQTLKILDAMTAMFQSQMGEFKGTYSIKDLSVNTPAKTPDAKPVSFSLKNAYWGIEFSQMTPPKSSIGFSMGMSGLNTNQDEFAQFIPQDFDINLKADNLPIAEIMDAAKSQIAAKIPDEQGTPQAPIAKPDIRAMLVNAGATLTDSIKIKAGAYNIDGNGTIKASSVNMFGATADQNLKIDGLDNIINELNKQAANTPQLRRAAGPLTMLQMMGQQDPNNPSVRTYHLVVDDQGNMTMNGSDLGAMIGGGRPTSGMGEEIPQSSMPQ